MKHITLTSYYNFTSGYGELLDVLLNGSFDFKLIPRTYTSVSDRYLNYFKENTLDINNCVDLCLLSITTELGASNPFFHMAFDRPRILYTMWESTRLSDLLVEVLNKFKCIIVPSNYNRDNFIRQGITTKIEVVPLFCDTDLYKYKQHTERDEFTFGISNEDPRKNLIKITNCFIKTFKNNDNVKLQIKTVNPVPALNYVNSRIETISRKLTKEKMRDWYHNLDVYVSGAVCEGWGMMQQESMCCGRPIIFTNYGGLAEFANKNNGFEVGYDTVYSTGYWQYGGTWSDFKFDEMCDMMLYCHNNREQVYSKGLLASQNASSFTKEKFIKNINKILVEYI